MKTTILFVLMFLSSLAFSSNNQVNNKLNTKTNSGSRDSVTIRVDCDGDGVYDYITTVAEKYAGAMVQQLLASC